MHPRVVTQNTLAAMQATEEAMQTLGDLYGIPVPAAPSGPELRNAEVRTLRERQRVAEFMQALVARLQSDPQAAPEEPLLVTEIEGVSERQMAALEAAGLTTAQALRETDDAALSEVPGIGPKTVEAIRATFPYSPPATDDVEESSETSDAATDTASAADGVLTGEGFDDDTDESTETGETSEEP